MAKYEIIKVQLGKISQSEKGSSFYKISHHTAGLWDLRSLIKDRVRTPYHVSGVLTTGLPGKSSQSEYSTHQDRENQP